MSTILDFRLCPPHFAVQGMRIDSPTANNSDTYERDAIFFKKDSRRCLMLRTAAFNEFDIVGTIGDWLKLPTLHVVVIQLVVGVHLVVPVYRGKPFFREVSTDNEVAMIVTETAKRGGINRTEFAAFERAFNNLLNPPSLDPTEVIH